jgi:Domain of unknown function (DUF4281)
VCTSCLHLCVSRIKGSGFNLGRSRTACAAFSPEQLFFASNCVMIPVYGLLLAAPRSSVLFRALTSHAVPFALGLGYIGAIIGAGMDVASVRDVAQSLVTTWFSGVVAMSEMFMEKWFTSVVWLNLLMLDFLMAREVALDAAERAIFAAHSIILCFMCGPVGFLSHLTTKKFMVKPELETAVPEV